jgi:hypothetical protein
MAICTENFLLNKRMVAGKIELRPYFLMTPVAHFGCILGAYYQVRAFMDFMTVRT